MHWKITPNSHRLNRLNQGQMAVSYESHTLAQSQMWCIPPTKQTNTQSHTLLDTLNEMSETCEIHYCLNHCSGKLCVFVCWHRRVWVYEHESIRMWVSECTHSHILTVHNILLWQLAGNGHHRLTVYDKQTCSRSPPLHRYLFNLCAYVFVCVGWWVYLSLSSGCKTPKPKKRVWHTRLLQFCVSTVYERLPLYQCMLEFLLTLFYVAYVLCMPEQGYYR